MRKLLKLLKSHRICGRIACMSTNLIAVVMALTMLFYIFSYAFAGGSSPIAFVLSKSCLKIPTL